MASLLCLMTSTVESLTVPLDTAAQHLVKKVPKAHDDDAVGTVLAELAGEHFDSTHAVYVVNRRGQLEGIVSFPRLLSAGLQKKMYEVMEREFPTALPNVDQEQVAALAVKAGAAEVAVVDTENHLMGVVPSQALLKIQRGEHIEDLDRMAGIWKQNEYAREAIEGATIRRVYHRLPWLLIGLLGSMVATSIMIGFEKTMEAQLAIAFFVPAILYIAAAVGTQSEAIAVRGLSIATSSFAQLLRGEIRTGAMIGLTLAAIAFPFIFFVFQQIRLAAAVSLSVLLASMLASTIGLLFPWLLSKLGKDPAYGSGPVATVIQDSLTLIIYFTVISVILL